jgi:3-oxoacyl-[acyl-carrier protein] reductase
MGKRKNKESGIYQSFMIKEKFITLIRIIFGKKPTIVQQPVNIVQLGETDLLKGKTALITGGTSGIGFSIAEAMLRAGASVIVTGRNQDKLTKSLRELEAFRRNDAYVYSEMLDMTNVESFGQSFNYILKKIEGHTIDILVNNAGTRGMCESDFGNAKEEDYDVIMNTNLKGMFFFSQLVAKYMKENHIEGNILNIASSSSLRPANSAYILSKWGIRGLTLGMAKALIPHGIVVNAIAPGPTATPMLNKTLDNVNFPQNPSGRLVTPDEIANMAVVMTSAMGRMAVGNIVYMTGGSGLITVDDAIYDF